MPRNLKRIPSVGRSGHSLSLGSKDPRVRRNAQGPLGAVDKQDPFRVDDKGREGLRQVPGIDEGATTAELIAALREAGFIED